jgi:hypothetical protein
MKYYLYILFFILLQCTLACKKKTVPIGDAGTIEFVLDAKISNSNVLLEAGKNNYFMHSTHYTAADNILSCEGQLGWQLEKDNHDYFKIIFKNYTTSSFPNPDSLFAVKDYNSYQPILQPTQTITGKAVQFTFTGITQNVQSYLWYFGDGDSSTLANPYHVYKTPGLVSVSCLVKYNNQIQDFLQNTIDVSFGKNCQAQFALDRLAGTDSIIGTAINHNNNNTWTMPNGNSFTSNSFVYTIPIGLRNYITLKDNSTCNTTYRQVVAPQNTLALCNYNYTAKDSTYTIALPPPNNYGTVILEYYTNGKKYVSYKADGSTGNKPVFHLSNKTLYQKNAANMRTAKIIGEIDNYFYNSTNDLDSIRVYTNKLQLAVAFP